LPNSIAKEDRVPKGGKTILAQQTVQAPRSS